MTISNPGLVVLLIVAAVLVCSLIASEAKLHRRNRRASERLAGPLSRRRL